MGNERLSVWNSIQNQPRRIFPFGSTFTISKNIHFTSWPRLTQTLAQHTKHTHTHACTERSKVNVRFDVSVCVLKVTSFVVDRNIPLAQCLHAYTQTQSHIHTHAHISMLLGCRVAVSAAILRSHSWHSSACVSLRFSLAVRSDCSSCVIIAVNSDCVLSQKSKK